MKKLPTFLLVFHYCMNIRRKVLVTLIILLPFILGISYVLAYCFLLPQIEKTILKYYAYELIEPIEYLRLKSTWFWKLTEYGYALGGGQHTQRINDGNKNWRRYIRFNDRTGKIKEDIYEKEFYRRIDFYDINGDFLGSGEEGKKGWNGNFYGWYRNDVHIYKDNQIQYVSEADKDGNLIAECSCRNNRPYNGKYYDYCSQSMMSCIDGKLVNSQSYPSFCLSPWGYEDSNKKKIFMDEMNYSLKEGMTLCSMPNPDFNPMQLEMSENVFRIDRIKIDFHEIFVEYVHEKDGDNKIFLRNRDRRKYLYSYPRNADLIASECLSHLIINDNGGSDFSKIVFLI